MPFSFLKFADADEKGDAQALDWLLKKRREKKARDEAAAKASEEEAKSGLAGVFGSNEDDKKDE